MTKHTSDFEPLAIVGIGCKLPGNANSPGEFWSLLSEGRSAIKEWPNDRWSMDAFYDRNKNALGKSSAKWGGFVEDIRGFDAEFFGISPREAEAMDPQQRMILTAVWEAFEDAGVSAERLRGSNTAVFVGASTFDYANVQHYRRTSDNLHTGTGNALCIIANRVSHKFDFHGPSITIDTACSSSIVATDMACRAIWSGQSDIAIAGGVNALLEPGIFISFSKANMISRTGRIRTFDAEADGFVRSEGAGALVIKRLSQAIEDGDRVYSVIRGTKVNQDGHTSTISVPSSDAQIAMLGDACRNAGIGVSDIDYVEAHGTGTPIGDPIEARAIGTVFGRERNRRQKVLVGACKTNVGHLEAGAGMAGIIKASLSLHHREIPRNINFKRPNPNIPFDDLGLALPLEHTTWAADNGRPRRAAVNAFGIGGTNACAILEEAPRHLNGNGNGHTNGHASKYLNGGRQYWFVPLGAQTEKALGKVASSLATTMEAQTDENGAHAVAANLALRRSHMTFRAAALADTPTDVVKILKHTPKAIESGRKNEGGLITGKRIEEPRIVFAFAGQGGTWWGMAHGLLKHDEVFRQTVEEIDRLYKEIAGWSIKEELLKNEADANPSTTHALPCLFALQSGLVARWKAWGIKPAMVIGHSSGELATAYAAGILTLPDALQVVYHRSRLQATQEGRGGIAAIAASRAEVERDLEEFGLSRLDIAAVNGPGMVNIAGDNESLRLAVEKMKAKHGEDFFATVLKVDFAPHCHHMEPLREELLDSLKDVRPNASTVPMVSTVTGHLLIGQMGDATYWWRNIRDAVLFDQGLKEALRLGGNVFIEIGPHINLSPMISAALSERGQSAVVVSSLNRKEEYDRVLRNSLATLYVNGVEPKWESFYGNIVPRLDLPAYPWEKKPFWMDSEESRAVLHGPRFHSLLGPRHFAPQPIWQGEISLEEHEYLVGHTVDGSVIFPGTGYLEMMFAAGREMWGEGAIELENVEILEAMVLSNERTELVQTTFEPGRNRISIFSKPRGSNLDWILRSKATMRLLPENPHKGERIKAPKKGGIAASELYKGMHARGYMHADAFNALRKLWPGDTTSVGQLRARAPIAGHEFHPALMDSCLHVGFGLGAGLGAQSDKLYLPVRLDRVTLYHTLKTPNLWARAEAVSFDPYVAINNVFVEDERGRPVLDIVGFTARSIPGRAPAAETKALKPVYIVEDWIETEAKLATKATAGRGQAWLVLREKPVSSLTARAEASLAAAGADIITVTPNGSFKKLAAGLWQVDPTNAADFERLIAEVLASRPKHKQKLDGIVFGWGLAAAERVEEINVDTLRTTEQRATIAGMHLLQAMAKNPDQRPRVWFLTRGVLPAGEAPAADASLVTMLAGAPLAGFARTALAEQPDLRSSVLDFDLDGKAAKAQASDLAGLLLGETDETEIALRGDKWFVPRLRQASEKGLPPKVAPYKTKEITRNYRAWMDEPGDLDDIRLVEMDDLHPGKGQVKVAVKGAALNFHDVMAATGMMPLGADLGIPHEELGYEYGGVISEVGPGIKGWKVGDRIMGMAAASFASEMLAEVGGVYRIPKGVSYTEAATIPIAFSTAYYALVHWARLRKGETALLHLGTGGVGLAGIQIARHIGAKIITTAGSPEKRAYLKKLGIEHVFDSRSLSFAEDVRRATNGKGVNVVLNALGGDAIPLGVNVMAPGGRFCEIGKRDVFSDSSLGLRALRQNGQFFVLDMARMHLDDPEGMKATMDAVQDLFAKGVYKALPTVDFKAGEISEAFKTMAHAKHIGKVVIDFGLEDVGIDLSTKHPMAVSPNGAYLISGGLGGFGAQTARWLAERGAKHLWLLGRSGASRPEAKELLAELKKLGVKAHVITADISKRADVEAVIKQIAKSKMPLRGVVHSAMVLDDAFITQLDKSRIMPVLEPKILGAWNLHQATEGRPLDFFVMYSSLASVFGSTGQANYVAANRFLDLLAGHRRRLGLPGTAVNWGTLGGTGAVQRSKKLLKYFKSMGMPPMDPTETLDCLGIVLRKDVAQIGACKVDWKLVTQTNTALRKLPRFSEVAATGQGGAGGGRIRTELLATKGVDRERILADFLAQQVAKVLKVEAKSIDVKRPLNEIGLDSLSSFQLKNRIESEVGVSLPVGKFLQKPTIISLATTISEVLDTTRSEKKDGGATGKDNSTARLPSPRQEWLWHQIRDNGPMPMHGMRETIAAIKMRPGVDVDRLSQAFRALVDHHEMLRSAFPAVDGKPTLATLPLEKFSVRGVDATQISEDEFMTDLRRLANTPHDIENGPLIDVRVFHRPDQTSVVVLRAHGILLDGWAFGMIMREMFQGYFGLAQAKDGEKAKGYLDFARWHRRWLDGDEAKAARVYWRDKLADLPAPIALGGRDTSLVDPHARGFWTKRFVSAKEGWEAREAARSLGVSLHALFVAAYHAHIYGVTGAKDVVIQSNAANRTRTEQEQMVGWFANEIFARAEIDPSLTLREHVQRVTQSLQESMEHTGYPTHLMLEAAGETNRDKVKPHFIGFNMMWPDNMDRSGFEQIMFQAEGTTHRFGSLELTMLPVGVEGAGSYLNDTQVAYQEVDGDILLSLHAREGVFENAAAAAEYLDRFLRVLPRALKNPDMTIAELAEIT